MPVLLRIGPRGGVTWAPFKGGKTTVRAGGGLFFDWFDAETYEQTLRVDGQHQPKLAIRVTRFKQIPLRPIDDVALRFKFVPEVGFACCL